MGDLWYLALAYGLIWLGLFAYLLHLAARSEGLRRELSLLKQMLQADPSAREGRESEAMSATTVGEPADDDLAASWEEDRQLV